MFPMSLQITRLIALQGAITLVIVGCVFAWGNSLNAAAALLGGAAATAAALAYGLAYQVQGGARSEKPFRTFLVAELCRIGAAIALLILGMAALPGDAAFAYLGAFAAALFAYLLIFLF